MCVYRRVMLCELGHLGKAGAEFWIGWLDCKSSSSIGGSQLLMVKRLIRND